MLDLLHIMMCSQNRSIHTICVARPTTHQEEDTLGMVARLLHTLLACGSLEATVVIERHNVRPAGSGLLDLGNKTAVIEAVTVSHDHHLGVGGAGCVVHQRRRGSSG